MHEWLSGGVSPCQGEGRGFESRLVLDESLVFTRLLLFDRFKDTGYNMLNKRVES